MAVTTDIRQQVFDLVSRNSSLSFVTAEEQPGRVSSLTPGQRVSAEIIAPMPNNRYQVRAGSDYFNLELPMAVRVGQRVEMTFVSGDPRSTFAIARPVPVAPPVSLSDASRLLSLLVSNGQADDPQMRASLQNIGDMLRRSSGESAVLAHLLDEALVYGGKQEPTTAGSPGVVTTRSGQLALDTFEATASRILKNIAQDSRFTLVEAANSPVSPLPLKPGQEVNGTIIGTLPGGRAFVQVAGETLELSLPQKMAPGDILRLTFIASEPKPVFAFGRQIPDSFPPVLSEAGRWLSVLEHSEGGISEQQSYVLERLNTVLQNLPPDSPAFSAINEDRLTYSRSTLPTAATTPSADGAAPLPSGNGIVLSDDMARLLQAVIKGNRLVLLESLTQQAAASPFQPGQQLKGDVLALLGGRATVQVAGQMLEFLTPRGIKSGDLITLYYISDEPRPTFLMARFGTSTEGRVSETGRWLSGFLGEASAKISAQATLSILKTVLTGPTSDATLLGTLLQSRLRESGLFYESHLARWFGGDYALGDILKEPQGLLSARLARTDGQVPLPGGVPGAVDPRSGLEEAIKGVFGRGTGEGSHEGIADGRTLPIVGEQLHSLQTGHLLLRGDLFPGQKLEWSVVERDGARNRAGVRERSWETAVSLNLPHLGGVGARIVLDGSRLSVKFSAEQATTVAVLEGGRERLHEQLAGAGLTTAEMSVAHVVTY